MDLKIAARMIAVLALGAGLTAAIAALRGSEDGPEDAPAIRLRDPGGEPAFDPIGRRSELARCRDIGATALEDAACRKAWAENRRRFFEAEEPEQPPMPKPERFGKTRPAEPAPAPDTDAPSAIPDANGLRPEADADSENPVDEEPAL
ncbi:putative entry exclusion protein TrbK-alt [Aureimonas altamirensis]|uniref:putative entry exclusion protein TrbK-alt n=1 Tax=Aureimonas altamirensis TaxID=370622 RepID=UPI0009E02E68|nr:putative entry exclusion protein TrbK-alt [Aureimonas altamirensis]